MFSNPWPHYKTAPLLGYLPKRYSRPTEEIKSCNLWLRQSRLFGDSTRVLDAVDEVIAAKAMGELIGSSRSHLQEI